MATADTNEKEPTVETAFARFKAAVSELRSTRLRNSVKMIYAMWLTSSAYLV
jgi:hypothetical protein